MGSMDAYIGARDQRVTIVHVPAHCRLARSDGLNSQPSSARPLPKYETMVTR